MKPLIPFLLLFATSAAFAHERTQEQRLFTLDESQWVLFYDLPSRRFRHVRDNLIRGNDENVTRDLRVSSNHINIEASRADGKLSERLQLAASELNQAAEANEASNLTISELNPVFARTHWLLAQHYLVLAQENRQASQHRNAGHYLAATAHHVERAILWSDLRPTRDIAKTLEQISVLSNRLLESNTPSSVYADKPMKKAWMLISEAGEHIDREPVIEPRVN